MKLKRILKVRTGETVPQNATFIHHGTDHLSDVFFYEQPLTQKEFDDENKKKLKEKFPSLEKHINKNREEGQ